MVSQKFQVGLEFRARSILRVILYANSFDVILTMLSRSAIRRFRRYLWYILRVSLQGIITQYAESLPTRLFRSVVCHFGLLFWTTQYHSGHPFLAERFIYTHLNIIDLLKASWNWAAPIRPLASGPCMCVSLHLPKTAKKVVPCTLMVKKHDLKHPSSPYRSFQSHSVFRSGASPHRLSARHGRK